MQDDPCLMECVQLQSRVLDCVSGDFQICNEEMSELGPMITSLQLNFFICKTELRTPMSRIQYDSPLLIFSKTVWGTGKKKKQQKQDNWSMEPRPWQLPNKVWSPSPCAGFLVPWNLSPLWLSGRHAQESGISWESIRDQWGAGVSQFWPCPDLGDGNSLCALTPADAIHCLDMEVVQLCL